MQQLVEPQILDGSYTQGNDIYVPCLIADGDYFNENGIGFPSSLLEQWHETDAWVGRVHNAHPSGNHPLAYEDPPADDLAESAQIDYYLKKSADWAFGTYVKTQLKTLANGSKRLIGIMRIADEGAKRAWKEGKFPQFVSSSVFVLQRDKKGFITDAYPLGVSSVKTPAYPPHIAGVSKQCTGGTECISQLVESSKKRDHNCEYCRYTVLSNFSHKYSSHSFGKVQESSMVDDKPNSPPEGEVKDAVTGQVETLSADGKTKLPKGEEQEIDWKTKFESLNKEHSELKSKHKITEETNSDNNKKIEKLMRRNVETAVRAKVDKVPMFVFDNKEENKEEAIKKFVSRFGKLTEEEILQDIDDTYHLAPKMMEISQKGKRVGESGLITNDGKLTLNKDEPTNEFSIFDATGVFGE
ncbi:hypothetical protein [Glutamicibacter sp.]|uniref:hypothetical protein n=1 Tax=Glutamicibacter sp. TaxID=1931995 RepID=UPI002B4786A8|nr:hypothetical protein [Glutamicibacter sp.]HJX79125.1 hypothetical protein [Glutamicibacter sp.]